MLKFAVFSVITSELRLYVYSTCLSQVHVWICLLYRFGVCLIYKRCLALPAVAMQDKCGVYSVDQISLLARQEVFGGSLFTNTRRQTSLPLVCTLLDHKLCNHYEQMGMVYACARACTLTPPGSITAIMQARDQKSRCMC